MEATMQHKNLSFEMELAEGERSFVAKITSQVIDRDKEVLLPQGMDASDFEKNPVVFFNHEHRGVPVGRVVSLKRMPDHWLAKVVLAKRPAGHVGEWMPDTLLSLIQQGVVRGVSVGFEPVESRPPTKRDKELFGEEVRRVYSKWKLMELSIAPLPANQDALIVAVSKGLVKPEQARSVLGVDVPAGRRAVIVYHKHAAPRRPRHDVAKMVGEVLRRELDRRRGRIYA